jgi:hypothetical protein
MPESLIDLAFSVATMNDPELIEKFPSEKRATYAQDLFAKGQELEVVKDVARWNEASYSREAAPFVGKRSPAAVVEGLAFEAKSLVIADIRIASNPIPIDELTSERAAQNALAMENRDKRGRVRTARELLAWQTLKGSVAINSTTVPGSSTSFSFTQAVTSLSPAASWATTSTLIESSELDRLNTAYHDACGLEARHMIMDNKVHTYLRKNVEVQANASANPNPDKRNTVNGPVGQSFEWEGFSVDVTRAKYSKAGTLTKYLGDDGLIVLPADSELPLVLGRAEGFGAIPKTAIGSADSPSALGGLAPSAGEYSYAYLIPEPAAVVLVFGWRGLYVLTFPEAVGYDDSVITP